MPTELETMKNRVKRLELEEKLKKLGGNVEHHSEKHENKKHNEHLENQSAHVKHELEELEKKKSEIHKNMKEAKQGKGFIERQAINVKGLSQLAGINKQINDRKGFLNRESQIRNLKQINVVQSLQIEANKKRKELNDVRKSANLKFEDIAGSDKLFKL